MTVKERIMKRLMETLQPIELDVVDESGRHEGHVGARKGGETHYRVYIVSRVFAGKRRVERHRMVYDALKSEIESGVHALALTTLAPEEV